MLPRFICNFLVRMLRYIEKNLKMFFPHKNLKKASQKVAYLWQLGVFFLYPKQPRTSFLFYKFFYPIVSAKVFGKTTSMIKVKQFNRTSPFGPQSLLDFQLQRFFPSPILFAGSCRLAQCR